MNNPAGLTLRELEVELLAGHGATDKEVAKILDIEIDTAKDYMKRIKRKYAKIGMKKGRHYLMTQDEYEQRMVKLVRILRAHHAFMERSTNTGKGGKDGYDARGEGQEVSN